MITLRRLLSGHSNIEVLANSMDATAEEFAGDAPKNRPKPAAVVPNPKQNLMPFARRPFYFGLVLVLASLILGSATYLVLTGETPIAPTESLVTELLGANLVLVLLLVAAIAWQVISVARARAQGTAGARLHVRLVTMFALVAVLPAVLVAIFATVTLDRGLDAWFSARTRAIIDGAQTVAESYLREHTQVLRSETIAMATDINRNIELYRTDKDNFLRFMTQQARLRAMSAAFIIRDDGKVGAQVIANRNIRYSPPPAGAIEQVNEGRVALFEPGPDSMIRALIRLNDFERGLLYVYRKVDQTVIDHLRKTREGRAEYDALALSRSGVQAAFAILYVGMALIFLLAAIWCGLWVANRLVAPIGRLIDAARQVSTGDLSISVDIDQREGDLAALARTFNEMITEVNSQRGRLIAANTTLDDRRRFMEAVLSGVSAGVIGLDENGIIELANRPAYALLGLTESDTENTRLADAVPELAALIDSAQFRPGRAIEEQVGLVIGGSERTIHVRITSESGQSVDRDHKNVRGGFVVTFDDITELQLAQRSSAWADIARRIAHEIKNPLTPIQLSAERLKRKYSKHIVNDREIFEQCTNTIIRQVGDIGRMVDEFSSFARMPKANFEAGNFNQVVRDAVILQKMSLQNIDFEVQTPDEPVDYAFDRRLVSQALTNLIKNASEAIESAEMADGERGQISVRVERTKDDCVTITVTDNGCGLPKVDRSRLTEPYMTTRDKGTGLGLAIVRRIMEEHGGTITLEDAPAVASGGHGASLRLEFPLRDITTDTIPKQRAQTEAGTDPTNDENLKTESS